MNLTQRELERAIEADKQEKEIATEKFICGIIFHSEKSGRRAEDLSADKNAEIKRSRSFSYLL